MKNLTINLINNAALVAAVSETANTGKSAVNTLTFPAKAAAAEGNFVVIQDANGVKWAVVLDKDGGGVANAGPIFAAISTASHMAIADISGITTAAEVATAAVTALNLVVGFTSALTLVDHLDGTVTVTGIARGLNVVTPLNAAESGIGTITNAPVTVGVVSAFNATTNEIVLTTTSFVTGQEVLVSINSGTLPAPLTAATFYIIKVSANIVKLAYSNVQAVAGIAVNLTDQGTADKIVTIKGSGTKSTSVDCRGVRYLSIQTNIDYSLITATALGSIALEASDDNVNYVTIPSSSQAYSNAVDSLIWEIQLNSNYVRLSTIVTSGVDTTMSATIVQKITPGY